MLNGAARARLTVPAPRAAHRDRPPRERAIAVAHLEHETAGRLPRESAAT